MSQLIYKNGCWDCKRTHEDFQQKYIYSIADSKKRRTLRTYIYGNVIHV